MSEIEKERKEKRVMERKEIECEGRQRRNGKTLKK